MSTIIKRVKYEDMSAGQLRIAIGKLGTESDIEQAFVDAARDAVANTLDAFGLTEAPQVGTEEVTHSQRRSKSSSGKKRGRPAGSKQANKAPSADEAVKLASRQLQGRYLAAIRSVPKSKRSQYKAIAKGPAGRQAAVDAIYRDYPRG